MYPQLLCFVFSVWYSVENLRFDLNRNNLVSSKHKHHQNYLRYKAEFPAQDEIVAVAESEDPEKNRQFVERLATRLEKETNIFTDVFYKGDLKMMGSKALLFITNSETLLEMSRRLQEARPMLEAFSHVTNLNSLFRLVNRQFRAATSGGATDTDTLMKSLPALARIIDLAADSLSRPGTPPSPGVAAMFDVGEEAEENLYITFANNRMYLVTARAVNEQLNPIAVERLRQLVLETQAEVPGISAGITGEPVLEVDEMEQSKRDTFLASLLSLALCALLFIYGYQETGRPLKATLCLVVGLGYTVGFATFAIGHLNILTITFLPILVGLAIDFGIHLITRYEEELRRGRSKEESLEKALVNTGQGILTGSLTVAGAFLAMGLTDFKGIREMGVISGCGVLICLVPMMTMLPALLLRGRQNVLDHVPHPGPDHRAKLEQLWLQRPGLVFGITGAVTVLALTQLPRVRFDYNLLNMQSEGLQSVALERKLISGATRSVIFGVLIASSPEQAAALETRARMLPSVGSVDSMAAYLGSDPGARSAIINQIKATLDGIKFTESDRQPVNLGELRRTLLATQAYFRLGAEEAERHGEKELAETLRRIRRSIITLRKRISEVDPDEGSRKLAAFQQALLKDLHETLEAIKNQDTTAPISVDDLPSVLKHRFIGRSGSKYLIQVNPKSNVWERAHQEVFVRELRSVDPDATGTPIQLYEYTTQLKQSYITAAYYALGAIAILVFLHFRTVLCVILALLPVALGAIWLSLIH
ncbi:MAG: MMPL family transporter, partial [Verrucomicrobiae bacterium]|nr:MMPL family transporter [Verrucomicrobiae bacterium]